MDAWRNRSVRIWIHDSHGFLNGYIYSTLATDEHRPESSDGGVDATGHGVPHA